MTIEWKMNMDYFNKTYRNKKRCSFTGGYLLKNIGKHHRALTRFIFQSAVMKTQSHIVNEIAGISWANQFKFMYTKKGPPMVDFIERSGDSRLGLDVHKIDIFSRFGLVSSENRWAVILPPP